MPEAERLLSWCRGPESNRHERLSSWEFKSHASSISPPRLDGRTLYCGLRRLTPNQGTQVLDCLSTLYVAPYAPCNQGGCFHGESVTWVQRLSAALCHSDQSDESRVAKRIAQRLISVFLAPVNCLQRMVKGAVALVLPAFMLAGEAGEIESAMRGRSEMVKALLGLALRGSDGKRERAKAAPSRPGDKPPRYEDYRSSVHCDGGSHCDKHSKADSRLCALDSSLRSQ